MIRVRTGFSFRTAAGRVDDVMPRLVECGYAYAPITDRASTFGYAKWSRLAAKAGLKPVFGVELAVAVDISGETKKKPIVDYWTFIAKDSIRGVNELLSLATAQFRYEPLLSYDQAVNAKGVFKIAGHRTQIDHLLERMQETTGNPEDVYIGLSPSCTLGYVRKAQEAGFEFAACSDNKFIRPGDEGFYEVLVGMNKSLQTYPQYIMPRAELAEALGRLLPPEAITVAFDNADRIAGASNAVLKTASLIVPPKPKTLRQLCEEGAAELGVDLKVGIYRARLDYELDQIAAKNFEDYFFIIADIMAFARTVMQCGPGRGSSAGSLVCYFLRITTVDPLKYGLLFERFIDAQRDDLPDIDLDFSDDKRDMVFRYVEERYGKGRVARLGTVANFHPRSAIGEAGAALHVPKHLCDSVLESLIIRTSGDSRALNTLEDTLKETTAGKLLFEKHPEIAVACRMEGHPRHYSQHAAGIVITSDPVIEYVAIDERTGATQCDKKDAEQFNLLKIDALGLTQLSVFEDALEMAGKPLHFLESVPLDDPQAFAVINDKKFSGIFQFNGPALQSISNHITVDSLADIVSITSLARPGPMASGGVNLWIWRKNGEQSISYPHPSFEPYLRETLGVLTFQEQVMQICREIGDMTWEDVNILRRAMSKSLGKEFFDKYREKFRIGATKKGMTDQVIDKAWDDLCEFGSYGFNKSHAVAYGIISYWCAYMKAHFPFEFAAATLSHESDAAKQLIMLREMDAEGIGYVPVDAEKSQEKWTAGYVENRKVLIGPLTSVRGLGPVLVKQIMSSRARGEPLPSRAQKLLAEPKTPIDTLYPIRDAIKRHMPNPAEKNIFTPPTRIIDIQPNGTPQDVLVFAVANTIRVRDENELIRVTKRGYRLKDTEPTAYLNMRLVDDSDVLVSIVDRFDFARLAQPVIDRGRAGKALYAVLGTVPKNFRIIRVKNMRYIGDMEKDAEEPAKIEDVKQEEDADV